MAITTAEKSNIHDMRAALKDRLDRMDEINDLAIIEKRDYKPQENVEYRDLEGECNELQALIQVEERKRDREHEAHEERRNRPNPYAAMMGVGQSHGTQNRSNPGSLARAIEDAGWHLRERPTVRLNIRSTFPSADVISPRQESGIVAMGQDTRFLWPLLPGQDIGTDTSVSDFRQTGSRTITGNVERDIDGTGKKAQLDVAISHVSEEVKQFAVLLESVPNVVLESMSTAGAFFESEMRYAINAELDRHVMAAILAANPPGDLVGTDLVAQVRHGISAMRAVGSNPSIIVLNPTDAANLDLFLQPGSEDYMFPVASTGGSSPLWNLRVVERTSDDGDEAPLLIDPARLGIFYTGVMDIQANPFIEFDKNLTTLRAELNALMHVRAATGAYVLEAAGDGGGDGDG